MVKKQEIVTRLSADSKQLNSALETTGQKLSQVAGAAKNAEAAIQNAANSSGWDKAGMGIASWSTILSRVGGAIGSVVDKFRDLQQQASSLKTTAEGVQRLDRASRSVGDSVELMRSAFSSFNAILASAHAGASKAQKRLAALGLTAEELGTNGEQAFLRAAEALGNITSEAERSRIQMTLFGSGTEKLSEALRSAVDFGQGMSGIVKDEDVHKVSQLAASWESIKDSLGNIAGELLAPPADYADKFLRMIQGENIVEYEGPNNDAELAAMDEWNAKYGYSAKQRQARKKAAEEARRRREQQAWDAEQERLAEEERIRRLREETRRQEEADKAANEMRRARLSPQQRWMEDREAAKQEMRRKTGAGYDYSEEWARLVWDPQHQPPPQAAPRGAAYQQPKQYQYRQMPQHPHDAPARPDYSRPLDNITSGLSAILAVLNNWPQKESTSPEAIKGIGGDVSAIRGTLDNWPAESLDDIGQFGRGNIDLYDRPRYVNEDGSVSTVRSMSFEDGGLEVLVPTISRDENNRPILLSDDEAIDRYYATGEHLGKFRTPEEADAYAQKLHLQQERLYAAPEVPAIPAPTLPMPEITLSLSQILAAVQALEKNTYVVE